jgi:hypothetical protein
MSHSTAKLYAAKFRWHRRATIFKLGGRDLSKPIKANKGFIGKIIDDHNIKLNGIIGSRYSHIKKPDRRPLNPDFESDWETIYKNYVKTDDILNINNVLRINTISGPITQKGNLWNKSNICTLCGSTNLVELHHKRALRYPKEKNVKYTMLIKSMRKTVLLCRSCHKERHGGSFK